eukprot:TRINITY_DN73289_c0_g1_i1.p1 TRINITY_DN73289_c0_g1~~TRINITY_DN73289_c0_g1_i1.p1  ORF type:complete len:473 (+),score=95.98 TRINITY_DN73289_c0_g1_i1:42-1460(+)
MAIYAESATPAEATLWRLAGSTESSVVSSLEVSFVVVSESQLVETVPVLEQPDYEDLLDQLSAIVDALEVEQAVLLADFEGEMTGFGGELVTAAFMPSRSIDRHTLQAWPRVHVDRSGLLLDMRCRGGAELVRRVMESPRILKVIWGADGDLTSLRHQELPFCLGFRSSSVVDAQLAFSTPSARLGMARMLDRVPPEMTAQLPKKEWIDFDQPHSLNRRALRWPLREEEARYAVDDLHRLDIIVSTQIPDAGGYLPALQMTEQIVLRIENDPDGIVWLQNELVWFERKMPGVQRRSKAVQLARHIKSLRAKDAQLGPTWRFIGSLEANLSAELLKDGVVIPADASFDEAPLPEDAAAASSESRSSKESRRSSKEAWPGASQQRLRGSSQDAGSLATAQIAAGLRGQQAAMGPGIHASAELPRGYGGPEHSPVAPFPVGPLQHYARVDPHSYSKEKPSWDAAMLAANQWPAPR